MKPLHWTVVCVVFWMAWVLFRLSTSVDIQNYLLWWLGLPIGFALPALAGWNLAQWRCHHRLYSLQEELGITPKQGDKDAE